MSWSCHARQQESRDRIAVAAWLFPDANDANDLIQKNGTKEDHRVFTPIYYPPVN